MAKHPNVYNLKYSIFPLTLTVSIGLTLSPLPLYAVETSKNPELEEVSITSGSEKRLRDEAKLPQANKKPKGGEIIIEERNGKEEQTEELTEDEGESITRSTHYSSMNIEELVKRANNEELAKRANNNDTNAQQEIIDLCLKIGLTPHLRERITPLRWEGITEKALDDDKYAFLVLRVADKENQPFPYVKIFESVKGRAEAGKPLAQHNLAYMYDTGKGVEQDPKQAFEWWTKAANQGHAVAQAILGIMYDKGQGVERDQEQAFEWYKKAANQGHALAQAKLGITYNTGTSTPKDVAQATFWFMKAKKRVTYYLFFKLPLSSL
jgi:TPR repeat protein